MAVLNWYQKYEPKDMKGLVTTNNLGALYMTEPYMISKMIENIYKVNLGDDLMGIINQFPTEEVPINRQYEWMLQCNTDKNIPLVSVSDINDNVFAATAQIGKARGRFKMTFVEDWFYPDHVIVGEKPDKFAIRVVATDGKNASGYYTYVCELVARSLETFITLEDLRKNSRWSIDYTLTEDTLSKRGTGTHHTSPYRMFTEMSFMRKEYTVPGNMISEGKNSPLLFPFMNQDGKTMGVWINKLDYDFMTEFRRERAKLLMYGKSNRLDDNTYYNYGASGYQIKAGMGLREQIAPANIHRYSDFNLETFVDYLLSLSIGKLPEDERRFVVFTGERGMSMVAKAMEQSPSLGALAGNANFATDRHIANALPKRFSGPLNKLTFNTGQITRYQTIQGIDVEFVKMASYDDPIRNKMLHPTKPGLAESYRLTIMDFGTSNGQSNIVRLVPKGEKQEGGIYIPGLRHPFAPSGVGSPAGGNGMPLALGASRVDGYEIHRYAYDGIVVKNPMRMGEWIPNVLV